MISVEKLTKKYGDKTALDHVSIIIPDHAIYAIVGPNGAGKTTFLKILSRILDFESGSVEMKDVFSNSEFRRIMGYLPEQRGLYGGIDIATQLRYFAAIRGVASKECRRNIDYWLGRFEITGWKYRRISELSKGMQQKVQMISCLIGMPKFIFMDEPFSGIDPFNYKVFTEVLKEYSRSVGATIVMSTHNMKSVDDFCSDVAFMKDGKMTVVGHIEDVRGRFVNEKLYEVVLLNNGKFQEGWGSHFTETVDWYAIENITEDGECIKVVLSLADEKDEECVMKRLIDVFSQYDVISCGMKRPSMEDIFLELS